VPRYSYKSRRTSKARPDRPYNPSRTTPNARTHVHHHFPLFTPSAAAAVAPPDADGVTEGNASEGVAKEKEGEEEEALATATLDVRGEYGTVDGPITSDVPLVGVATFTNAVVADTWKLSLSDWKLAWAAAEAVAWTETLVLVVVGEEVSERVLVVRSMSIEMYNSMYQ
jgi:hypothetical protein